MENIDIISSWQFILWLIFSPIIIYSVYRFYRNDQSLSEMPLAIKRISQWLRSITLILLMILLFSPIIKWTITHIKKPLIAIAVDCSESMKFGQNFKNDSTKLVQFIKNQTKNTNYNIKVVGFGSSVFKIDSLIFNQKATNIANAIESMHQQYEFDNLSAIVLISDGNYNQGINPIYAERTSLTPIYTICLGDTNSVQDIYIQSLTYPQKVFIGNILRIEVNIKAENLQGKSTKVKLINNENEIENKTLSINKNDFYQKIQFLITPQKTGTYQYTIEIEPIDNEHNTQNNRRLVIFNVISEKRNVYITSSFPHPDIGAIKTALENNQELNVYLCNPDQALDSIIKADALILYQLPSMIDKSEKLIQRIINANIPTLFILGSQTNISLLNHYLSISIVNSKLKQTEDAYCTINANENIFNLTADQQDRISEYPPLLVPFGEYYTSNLEIVAFQRIRQVKTTRPLIAFVQYSPQHKVGFICGEGVYRWRLAEYFKYQENQTFNILINKIVNYLMFSQKKERFRVIHQTIYNETDNIVFEAELYNKSFEPITNAEIRLNLKNKEKTYTYTFMNNQPYYSADLGRLPAGKYHYTAIAKAGNETFTQQGSCLVSPENIEYSTIKANVNLMNQLAKVSGGRYLPIDSLDYIFNILDKNNNIVATTYSDEAFVTLINFRWLIFIVVMLISIEWFLRRFYGSL